MECACYIGECDGEAIRDYENEVVRARKNHRCLECGEDISKGEQYERVTGIDDEGRFTMHTCLGCVALANGFYCPGHRSHAGLAADVEYVFGFDYRADPSTYDDDEEDGE